MTRHRSLHRFFLARGMFVRHIGAALLLLLVVVALAGCSVPASSGGDARASDDNTIIIFHAGSLSIPVKELAAAFTKAHPGVTFATESSGSRTAARKISELHKEADVMMAADYTVIDNLLIPDFADWNIQFARNAMVIVYTDKSNYADEINADNWYEILLRDGVAYGHSDPDADPCGYRTLMVWQLAEKHYGVPGLAQQLDDHCPPKNVRPKAVELLSLLQSGDMDYAFEYLSVAVQHDMNYVMLPDEINLSQMDDADFYRQATIEISGSEPGSTVTKQGAPIVYGLTIPKNAPHPDLATAFVAFVLGPEGQAILKAAGQPPIVPPMSRDTGKLPAALQSLVKSR